MSKETGKCESCGQEVKVYNPFAIPEGGNVARIYPVCHDCLDVAMRKICISSYPKSGLKTEIILELIKKDQVLKKAMIAFFRPVKKIKKTVDKNENKSFLRVVSELYPWLNKKVIGQEDAKKKLTIAIQRKMISASNPKISKVNVLMIGPSGTGKTELANAISDYIDLPMVKIDCSHLTPSGYKGSNVDTIFNRLLHEAGGDIELAQYGIVFLDEIDKALTSSEFGHRIQQELLKVIEGDDFSFEEKKNLPPKVFSTKNLTFIAGGSFSGLEKVMNPNAKIGVQRVHNSAQVENVTVDHLISFGMIPELAGRFSSITTLKSLSREDLYRVLKCKENSLVEEYENLFSTIGIDLKFSEEFINMIIDEAFSARTGTRKLREIMENHLQDYIFQCKTPFQWVVESSHISEVA